MAKYYLNEFECISDKNLNDLKSKFNIVEVDDFYKYSKDQLLNGLSNIEEKVIDQWISVLDLFKIPTMTARNAELLYHANINSIEELAHRDAARIYYKLQQLDKETYLIILKYPSFAVINKWIDYAKLMICAIKYSGAIPLIQIPNFTVERAAALQVFGIYTVDDLLMKIEIIPGLKGILKMKRKEYKQFMDYVHLLAIDGVDVNIAYMITKAMLGRIKVLKKTNEKQLLKSLKQVESSEKNPDFTITEQEVHEIFLNIKELEAKN